MRRLPLASAVVRSAARRAAAWVVAARPAAVLACLALGLLPLVLARAGTAVARELGPALADVEVARGALAGAALPCLAAGVVLAVAHGRRGLLGPEHAAAPVGRLDRVAATAVLPAATALVLGVPAATALVLPIAAASPGGAAAAPAALAALACAALAGGALAAAWRRAVGGSARDVLGGVALAAGSLAAAGPLEPAARALAGDGGPVTAALASLSASALLAVAWACLGEPPSRNARRATRASARIPRHAALACLRAALALLVRRRDVRSACVGAVAVAAAGLGVAAAGRAPAPTGLLLAAAGAAVCLAPVGLAVTGAILDGRALWQVAPVPRATVALGWAGASAVVAAAATLAALSPAVAVERQLGGPLALAAALVAAAWSCALAAGALVPWRPHGVGDQVASLVAFGLLVAASSTVSAHVGPALASRGLGDAATAALVVGLLAVAGTGLVGRRVGAVG